MAGLVRTRRAPVAADAASNGEISPSGWLERERYLGTAAPTARRQPDASQTLVNPHVSSSRKRGTSAYLVSLYG